MRRRDFGTWFAILLFPAVFIPAGTAGLIIGGGQTIDAIRSPDWPRATGKIVYVARKSQSVDVRVVYDYPVGGQYYRSMRHSFGSSYARPSHSYKVGDSVAVFYDPADPQSAVLDPGLEAGPGCSRSSARSASWSVSPSAGSSTARPAGTDRRRDGTAPADRASSRVPRFR